MSREPGSRREGMNRNVWNTLALQPTIGICTSLTTASQMSAYLLLRTGSQTKVGLAVGAQGVANLCAAFPGGWIGDRYGRSVAIRMAVCFGAIGYVSVMVCVQFAKDLTTEHQYYCIAAALFFVGLYTGSQNPNVEAIFGDSVPSGSRSKIYAWKSSLRIAGNSVGPIVSVCVFAILGNEWRTKELKWVMTIGAFAFLAPCCFALSLKEKHSLGHVSEALLPGSSSSSSSSEVAVPVTSPGSSSQEAPPPPPPPRPQKDDGPKAALSTRRRIAATVVISDLLAKLGSGCTIKFVPLFFLERCKMSPITVNAVSAVGPLGAAALAIVAQKVSKKWGRVQVTWITKVIGALSLAGIAFLHNNYIIIPLYLGRVCFMNCSTGLTKSVLNDYVPKSERARWNSFEAVNTFGWSGSAAIGGFIIQHYGYSIMFIITAAMQILAATILLSIAPLVHLEGSRRPPPREPASLTAPLLREHERDADLTSSFLDDDKKPQKSIETSSDAGYSLLDFNGKDVESQSFDSSQSSTVSETDASPPKQGNNVVTI